MLAKREYRKYEEGEQIWVGKYRNSQNVPHWHTDCELITVEKGAASFYIEDKGYKLKEGQSFFVPPRTIHCMKGEEGSILSLFIYDCRLTESITNTYTLCSPVIRKEYNIGYIHDKIEKELKEKKSFYSLSANQELISLIISIFRGEEVTEIEKVEVEKSVRFKQLLEDMDKRYAFYTLQVASDFMGLSTQYFSKNFHEITGVTFSQYLNYIKTEKAVQLIQENRDVSMTEVAINCGFGTIRNFNRVFKKVTGYVPKYLPEKYVVSKFFHIENIDNFDPTDKNSVLLK